MGKFNKKHLWWIIPLSIIIILIGAVMLSNRLTLEQKAFKDKCESSGGTFILCSGSQGTSFFDMWKGSCEPAGRLKCYCPEMKGLTEENGVCI